MTTLQNTMAIAIYDKIDDKFVVSSYKNYDIKYMRGKKNCLRIIVNGVLTKITVNLCNYNEGYKGKILKAIYEYETNPDKTIKQHGIFCIEHLKNMSGDNKEKLNIMQRAINDYLISIKQENNRDKLSLYNLVNIYHS